MTEVIERKPYQLDISIPFPSTQDVSIIYQVLKVDKELKPHLIEKEISIIQTPMTDTTSTVSNRLHISLTSISLRQLRTSTNALMDQLALICETLNRCDPLQFED